MVRMNKYWVAFLVALLAALHLLIVAGSTLSLPIVLLFPGTRWYFLAGIVIVLATWAISSTCPLTDIEKQLREKIKWPQLRGSFTSHYLEKVTGMQLPNIHVAELVYLTLVIAVILLR